MREIGQHLEVRDGWVRVARLAPPARVEAHDGASAGIGDAGAAERVEADRHRLDEADDVAHPRSGQCQDQQAAAAVPPGVRDDEVAVRRQRQRQRADQRIGIGGRVLRRRDVVRRLRRRQGAGGPERHERPFRRRAFGPRPGAVGGKRGEDLPARGIGEIDAPVRADGEAARQPPAAKTAERLGIGDRALPRRAERDLGPAGESARQGRRQRPAGARVEPCPGQAGGARRLSHSARPARWPSAADMADGPRAGR